MFLAGKRSRRSGGDFQGGFTTKNRTASEGRPFD